MRVIMLCVFAFLALAGCEQIPGTTYSRQALLPADGDNATLPRHFALYDPAGPTEIHFTAEGAAHVVEGVEDPARSRKRIGLMTATRMAEGAETYTVELFIDDGVETGALQALVRRDGDQASVLSFPPDAVLAAGAFPGISRPETDLVATSGAELLRFYAAALVMAKAGDLEMTDFATALFFDLDTQAGAMALDATRAAGATPGQ